MKRIAALTGSMLLLGALACAQETGNRIVVPNKNGVRPRLIEIRSTNGSIAVKAGTGSEVVLDPAPSDTRRREETREGMHRIDLPWRGGVDVEQENDKITIRSSNSNSSINLTVPANIALSLRCTNGGITVDGIHGEVDADSTNGSIHLNNISGTVVANTRNGGLHVTMDQVDPGKPMSFSSYNSKVDVTLPADLKATVKMKTEQGDIWSDFDIKVTGTSQPVAEKTDSGDGKMRLRFDQAVNGTINGGGTQITFSSYNGDILIHKKK